MNLKKFRQAHNLTQTQLANILCVSLRHYQRFEAADFLPKQSAKILSLILALNAKYGSNYMKRDCLKINLDSDKTKEFIRIASNKLLKSG